MAATLVVTFACLIPLLLPSLFAPVPTVCFRFPADFEIMKEPRTKVPASADTDFWVVFCRDESNGRTNYPLCVVPLLFFCFNSCSAFPCFLVFFFGFCSSSFLWFCIFPPWFCFFRLGLAWVFPRFLLQTPCFSSSVCWVFLLCSSNDFRFNSPEILLPLPLLCSVFYRAPACRKPLPLFINLWAGSWARDRGVVALNCRICFLLNRSGPCETEGMVNSGIKTASSCIKKMTDYESVP